MKKYTFFSSSSQLDFLDRLTQISWSLYRASPLKNLVLASKFHEEFSTQQAELVKPALKNLRAFLDSELPSLDIQARLMKDPDTSNLKFQDCSLKTREARGWVSTLPASSTNQEFAAIGIEVDLQMQLSSIESSESRRLAEYATPGSSPLASFAQDKILIVILTGLNEAGDLDSSLVLAKGSPGAVGLSMRWLEIFCDARVSQFYMAPHQMQDILVSSLVTIIRHHYEALASTNLIESPKAELKFQFPPGLFPHKELDSLTVGLPWTSILSVWDTLFPKTPLLDEFASHCEGLIACLEDIFHELCGISLKELLLRQFGTPLLLVRCHGKLKFIARYPKECYIRLIDLLISLAK
ncbi:hypothetical protein DSO57_1006531 [Entomophthora muscae]|uniref:Uncharacterized protein n=2 Tax=Entomophthora muscae TaxID=34485 RepID=A0ACC2S9U3_9FUNG|nr:hypothetical protein DSO57_1006531 [Entomophthora muscae]